MNFMTPLELILFILLWLVGLYLLSRIRSGKKSGTKKVQDIRRITVFSRYNSLIINAAKVCATVPPWALLVYSSLIMKLLKKGGTNKRYKL